MSKKQVRIGLLGFGTVGGALIELIEKQHPNIEERTGVELIVTKIAVRDLAKQRAVAVESAMLTTDPMEVVESDYVDVVVELMGGIDPARELLVKALTLGKPVVTGNKALVAAHGAELFNAAREGQPTSFLFEASVAGGIPLMRVLEQSLRGEPLNRVMGILNGTTNYILTQMTENGATYADALQEAQNLGYAEADPTADVEGIDAGSKAAIIATVTMPGSVRGDDVSIEGISSITAADIAAADRMGFVIKLLAIIERLPAESGEDEVAVRVHPAMVPKSHPLANVNDSFNAVFIEGEAVGELMLYGRGAGGFPTASAVLGDIISAALSVGDEHAPVRPELQPAKLRSSAELMSASYLELVVSDNPGVLSEVASVFGAHNVSIKSMDQHGSGEEAVVIFITHEAREADMMSCVEKLTDLDCVQRVGARIRVIGE